MRAKSNYKMSKIFAAIVALSMLMLHTRVSMLASGSAAGEIDLPVPLVDILSAIEEDATEAFEDPLLVEIHSQSLIETWVEDEDGNQFDSSVEYETAIDESYSLHPSFTDIIDRLALPFEENESAIFRSRLYAELEGKRMLRFFDSDTIGEGHQAIVTLDTGEGSLGVHFVNNNSRERAFRLVLTDQDGLPLSHEELSATQFTGSMETLSEERLEQLLSQPDVDVEILTARTVISSDVPTGLDALREPVEPETPADPDKPDPSDNNGEIPSQPDVPEPDDPADEQPAIPSADFSEPEPPSAETVGESYYLSAGEGESNNDFAPDTSGDSPADSSPEPRDESPTPDVHPTPVPDENPTPDPDEGNATDPRDGPPPHSGEERNPDPDGNTLSIPNDNATPDPDADGTPNPGVEQPPNPNVETEIPPIDGEEPEEPDLEEPDEAEESSVTVSEGVILREASVSADTPAPAHALAQRAYSIPSSLKTNYLHVRTVVAGGSRGGSFTYEITDKDGKYIKSVLVNGQSVPLSNGRITVTDDKTITVAGWVWDIFNVRQVDSPAGTELVRVLFDGQVCDPDEGLQNVWPRFDEGVNAVFVNAPRQHFSDLDGDIRLWKRALLNANGPGDESLYDMELIAAGNSGFSRGNDPVNVILVLDRSLSMNLPLQGGVSSWNATRNAASRMILDILNDNAHPQSKVAVIGYGETAQVKAGWTGKDGAARVADELSRWAGGTSSSTSWRAGYEASNELLKSADKDALQYVLLVSDGTGLDVPGAVSAAKQLNRDHPQARILTVGVGGNDPFSALNPSGEWRYQDAYAPAYNSQDILDAFGGFTNIIKLTVDDPVIADTLSEYVDFAESEPTFGFWYCDAGSAEHEHNSDCDWKPLESPGKLQVDGKTVTWTINTLNADFSPALEDWIGYRLTYPVRVTNGAGDYPDTGQFDTGTHEGQPGWRSNEDAMLLLGGEKGMAVADFPHPVVQAKPEPMPTASLKIVKYGDALSTNNQWLSAPLRRVRFELREVESGQSTELPLTAFHGATLHAFTEPGSWALYETSIGPNSYYQLRSEQLATITVSESGVMAVTDRADGVKWDSKANTLRVFNYPVAPDTINIIKYGDPVGNSDPEESKPLRGVHFELRGAGYLANIRPDPTGRNGETSQLLSKQGIWSVYETDLGINTDYQLRTERLAVITVGKSKTITVSKLAEAVKWDPATNTLRVFNSPVPSGELQIVKLGDPFGNGKEEDLDPLPNVQFELRGAKHITSIYPEQTDSEGAVAIPMDRWGKWSLFETELDPASGYRLRTERLATITVGKNKAISAIDLAEDVEWNAHTNTLRVLNPPVLPEKPLQIINFGDPQGNRNEVECERLEEVSFYLRGMKPTEDIALEKTDNLAMTKYYFQQPGSWELYQTDMGPNTGYRQRTEKLATVTVGKDGLIQIDDLAEGVTWDAADSTLRVFNRPVPVAKPLQIINFGDPVGNFNESDCSPLQGVYFYLDGHGRTKDIRPEPTDQAGTIALPLSEQGRWTLYQTDLGSNDDYTLRTEPLAVITVGKNGAINVRKTADGVTWAARAATLRVYNTLYVPDDRPLHIVAYGDPVGQQEVSDCEALQGVQYYLKGTDGSGDLFPTQTDSNGITSHAFTEPGKWELHELFLGPNLRYRYLGGVLGIVTVNEKGATTLSELSDGVQWDAETLLLKIFHPRAPAGGTMGRHLYLEKALAPGADPALLNRSPATFELRRGDEIFATATANQTGPVAWTRLGEDWDPSEEVLPTGLYTLTESFPGERLVLDSITITGTENLSSADNVITFLITGANEGDGPIRVTATNREMAPTEGDITITQSFEENTVFVRDAVTYRYEITGGRTRGIRQALITLTPDKPAGSAVIAGLQLGEQYTVTSLSAENYLVVDGDVQVLNSLAGGETIHFVGGNRRTNGDGDRVVLYNRVHNRRGPAFTIRLTNSFGGLLEYALVDGEQTPPITGLLYGAPYTVGEVNIPNQYRFESVLVNDQATSTFTVTESQPNVDIVVTNRYIGSSSSGGGGGGSSGGSDKRDTDPYRGAVIPDERVPKTSLPVDAEGGLDAGEAAAPYEGIPNTGGFPIEAVGLLGVAVFGAGYLIHRRRK